MLKFVPSESATVIPHALWKAVVVSLWYSLVHIDTLYTSFDFWLYYSL